MIHDHHFHNNVCFFIWHLRHLQLPDVSRHRLRVGFHSEFKPMAKKAAAKKGKSAPKPKKAAPLAGKKQAVKATKADSGKPYDLIVLVKLRSAADVAPFLAKWRVLQRYCQQHEKDTLTYEAFVDPATPDTVVIVERYTSEAALREVHYKSTALLTFAKWGADSGMVVAKTRLNGHLV